MWLARRMLLPRRVTLRSHVYRTGFAKNQHKYCILWTETREFCLSRPSQWLIIIKIKTELIHNVLYVLLYRCDCQVACDCQVVWDSQVVSLKLYLNTLHSYAEIWQVIACAWGLLTFWRQTWRQKQFQTWHRIISILCDYPIPYLASFFDDMSGIKKLTNFMHAITSPSSANKSSSMDM